LAKVTIRPVVDDGNKKKQNMSLSIIFNIITTSSRGLEFMIKNVVRLLTFYNPHYEE